MKKIFVFLLIMSFGSPMFSQNIKDVEFIHQVGEKKIVNAGDAVKFLVLTIDDRSAGFKKDLESLKKKGIALGYDFNEKELIRKGAIARMTARLFKLNNSLMYKIFKTERYAFRECVAAGIISADGSEWDLISGEELIEIMSKIGEKIEVASEKK